MVLSIYAIVSAATLLVNALAILSETRLLSKLGLATVEYGSAGAGRHGPPSPSMTRQASFSRDGEAFVPAPFDADVFAMGSSAAADGGGGGGGGRGAHQRSRWRAGAHMKTQIALLLSSVRMLLRWPLIIVNTVLIVLAFVVS